MDASKTRIWSRSVLGLAEGPVREQVSESLATPGAGTSGSVDPTQVVAPGAGRPQARALVSRAPLQATRILPIEQLLPASVPDRPERLTRRFGRHVLLATLTVVVVALWQVSLLLRNHGERARVPDNAKRSHTARVLAMPHATPPSMKAPERVIAGAAAVRGSSVTSVPAGLERRAIDLVIAGDLVAAHDAYETLARQRRSAVFESAARIVARKRVRR